MCMYCVLTCYVYNIVFPPSDDPLSQRNWCFLLPCLYSPFCTSGFISYSPCSVLRIFKCQEIIWFRIHFQWPIKTWQDFCVVCVSTYAVNVLLFLTRCVPENFLEMIMLDNLQAVVKCCYKCAFPGCLAKLSSNFFLPSWCKRSALGNVKGKNDRWK